MAFIHSYSDGVGTLKLITKEDIDTLEARAQAKEASDSLVMQYVRNELNRIIESAKAYADTKYIARCAENNKRLAGSNQEFKNKTKKMLDTLITEASLQCRIQKGSFDYSSMTKCLAPAFKKAYGKSL
nr:hypothetical protein [Candidatus Enterousia merdequi]